MKLTEAKLRQIVESAIKAILKETDDPLNNIQGKQLDELTGSMLMIKTGLEWKWWTVTGLTSERNGKNYYILRDPKTIKEPADINNTWGMSQEYFDTLCQDGLVKEL